MADMRMLLFLVGLCHIFLTGTAAQLYDVTTIYRFNEADTKNPGVDSKQASVHIHARTNALGMPVSVPTNFIPEIADTETNMDSWPSDSETTSWSVENWTESEEDLLEAGQFRYSSSWKFDNSFDYTTLTEAIKIRRGENQSFVFIPTSTSSPLIIKTNIYEYIYMRLTPQAREQYSCRCCGGTYGNMKHVSPEIPSNYICVTDSRTPIRVDSKDVDWKPGHGYKFNIKYYNSYFEVRVYYDSEWHSIASQYNQYGDRYFQLGTEAMKGYLFNVSNRGPYLKLVGEEGRLRSPDFFPSFKRVCVVLESSITPDSQGSLELHAERNLNHEKFLIGKIDSHEMPQEGNILGWSTHRFLVDVPEGFENDSIHIVLSAKKSIDGHVFVHKISGCNGYGNEDVTVFPKKNVINKSELPAYTVDDRNPVSILTRRCLHGGSYDQKSRSCSCPVGFTGQWCELGQDKKCLHGGTYDRTSGSCNCPVGFVGEQCEEGCGRNRFGNDCGGTCSGFLSECKNMILCRPGSSTCECAPGIKGDFCDADCADGEYGAGCRETCGNCKYSPCNPYTGVCPQGCLPGFYPPFCKTTYKYMKSSPEVEPSSLTSILVRINLDPSNMVGEGDPRFYQLQYMVQGQTEWLEEEPRIIPNGSSNTTIEEFEYNVTNLLVGTSYEIRVVLINKDGETCDEEHLRSAVGKTLCTVPDNVDYKLRISQVQENGFQVDWDFEQIDSTWCPVTQFEVHVNDASLWISYKKSQEDPHTLVVTSKLPGTTYFVKVRGITFGGSLEFSPEETVTTNISEPGNVRHVRVVRQGSTEIALQWDRPWSSEGSKEKYIVQYECQRQLACRHENCSSSTGNVTATKTSVLLEDLLPHSQYLITVSAVLSKAGSATSILTITDHSVAAVAPDSSAEPVSRRTNTSFVLHWSEPEDCKMLNSYLYGYRYELRLANTSTSDWLLEGTTEDTSAQFTGLEPMTEYEARVFLVTSAGCSKDHFLVELVTTTATVPGAVRQLTVYKRSRREIALRWRLPEHVYGQLESFRISYSFNTGKGERAISKVISPRPCVAWPESYCHTISGLKSDTSYAVTVQAKNSNVEGDGESTTVRVVTREGGAPDAPVKLRLVSRTQFSLTVAWELPRMLNGVLRSFVVNIEEVDSHNSSECCQYYPLEEMPIRAELRHYLKEISDLKPSSKYSVSVSGKTTSLGPSANLSATTRPDVADLPEPPEVDASFQNGSTVSVTLHPSTVNSDLLRGYLLLVVPRDQAEVTAQTRVYDTDLAEQLNDIIGSPFYIAAEFQPVEFEVNIQFEVGTGSQPTDGVLCHAEDPVLRSGEYNIGLAVILEYCGAFSVGYVQSELFTVM